MDIPIGLEILSRISELCSSINFWCFVFGVVLVSVTYIKTTNWIDKKVESVRYYDKDFDS